MHSRTFRKNVDLAEVDHISIFDGNIGVGFTIDDPDDIQYIVKNIISRTMNRPSAKIHSSTAVKADCV